MGVSFDQHIHINDLLDVISETEDKWEKRFNHFSASSVSQITGEARGSGAGAVTTFRPQGGAGARHAQPQDRQSGPASESLCPAFPVPGASTRATSERVNQEERLGLCCATALSEISGNTCVDIHRPVNNMGGRGANPSRS